MAEDAWSVSDSTVYSRALDLLDDGRDAVVATIVGLEGSAYRRPGAKMIVTPDGEGIGSVTAGCLEDEVIELGESVLADGHPRIETFDLMRDDDIWGLGLGCNGIIDISIEPLDARSRPFLEAYEAGDAIASATVLESEFAEVDRWQRLFIHPDDEISGGDGGVPAWLTAQLTEIGRRAIADRRSETVTIRPPHENGAIDVFVDAITPPPQLLIIGTGHDVSPLVELGKKTDFKTTVVGFRGGHATEERFPDAHAVLSTSPPTLRDAVTIDDNTYTVVMTHNYVDDRLSLDELLKSDAPYIGLMGPRERFEDMVDAFAEEGRTFTEAELERIYTPVGLDLGGGTPFQIASSIIAEVTAVYYDRAPRHLREREGAIHAPAELEPAP